MTELYPLRFKPIFKEKIWGGSKIRTLLNKDFGNLLNCGESWELSAVPGEVSEVISGPFEGKTITELIDVFGAKLIGGSIQERFGNEFPLLIKFIDAQEDLSIQVHPDDFHAGNKNGSSGKTEMWYILQADPGASLISGFNQASSPEQFMDYINQGRVLELLNKEEVRKGDVYFIPAGRVHTIGKGILLAEIQQTSDITYRIYDFDRIDRNSKKRELHLEEAVEVIDYNRYDSYVTRIQPVMNQLQPLVTCTHFTTNRITINQPATRDYTSLDSFVIYIVVEGQVTLKVDNWEDRLEKGFVILVPAESKTTSLIPVETATILEVYIN